MKPQNHISTLGRSIAAASIGLMLMSGSALAEGYASYDKFDGSNRIDPARWLNGDRQRALKAGALSLIQRDDGMQLDDTGLLSQSWRLDLTGPATVTQMRATITVNQFEVTGCESNPTPSTVQARLIGGFFNAGTPFAGGQAGDVQAVARLYRDSHSTDAPGLLRVDGRVVQCMSADCNYHFIELGRVDLGTAATGEPVALKLEWESARKRFNFYRGSGSAQRVNYTVDDFSPPVGIFRSLSNRTSLAHCFSGARTTGLIDAKYDNVAVNASALP